MELSPLARKALANWEQNRPNMVKELRSQGRLKEALEHAASVAEEERVQVSNQLREQHPNRSSKDYLKRLQMENEVKQRADEIVLPRYILLPPEGQETTASPLGQSTMPEDAVLSPKREQISKRSGPSKR